MIQDIFPHTLNNEYIATKDIRDEDYVFYFRDKSLLLLQNSNTLKLPRKSDFENIGTNGVFIFKLDGFNCFLVWDCPTHITTKFSYHEINSDTIKTHKTIDYTSMVAYQLCTWYRQHKFCGSCGSPTQLKTDERAIVCPSCKTTQYPQISPAIIVGIFSKDKILLARGKNFRNNMYSLVAGYVDIGESIEDTVKREVKEEVGLDIANIRYYSSQPWPYSGSMMIGFIADGDDTQAIKVDDKEIVDAAWFSRDNLPNYPTERSIAGEIINKFIRKQL
ncbi:NAD(+) diphosphatase [Carboxylicivirga sp. N1Y90]|uniref:NAD(+) diphosphatase n=1 Tax=Carboxylicivirga fragile TaxID=3417571 RepID=UPI003D346B92|nr:NAD(+) diphosphatase [Marinilabiliaceae bacterium N1Y90]